MREETQNTLLYVQLQEGRKYVLMKAPAVSGAREYQELCIAAKNEERWLTELNKRQYLQEVSLIKCRKHSGSQLCGSFGSHLDCVMPSIPWLLVHFHKFPLD